MNGKHFVFQIYYVDFFNSLGAIFKKSNYIAGFEDFILRQDDLLEFFDKVLVDIDDVEGISNDLFDIFSELVDNYESN